MFDVGFWEFSLIFVVALLVVGPDKLPGLARTVGLYVGKARRYADYVRREIESEVRTAELREAIEKPAVLEEVKEAVAETEQALKETELELQESAGSIEAPKETPLEAITTTSSERHRQT